MKNKRSLLVVFTLTGALIAVGSLWATNPVSNNFEVPDDSWLDRPDPTSVKTQRDKGVLTFEGEIKDFLDANRSVWVVTNPATAEEFVLKIKEISTDHGWEIGDMVGITARETTETVGGRRVLSADEVTWLEPALPTNLPDHIIVQAKVIDSKLPAFATIELKGDEVLKNLRLSFWCEVKTTTESSPLMIKRVINDAKWDSSSQSRKVTIYFDTKTAPAQLGQGNSRVVLRIWPTYLDEKGAVEVTLN